MGTYCTRHQGQPKACGESPTEPVRNPETVLASWAGCSPRATRPTVEALRAYGRALDTCRTARDDPRVSADQLASVRARLLPLRDTALETLDPLLEAGLARREGQYIVPPAIVHPAAGRDYAIWTAICLVLRALGVQTTPAGNVRTRILAVCAHCTIVFRPRGRKTIAAACPMCAHRRGPLAPALGLPGQRITRNGDRATVRSPILAPGGRLVVGWRNITIGKCAECGDPFHGRADRVTCSEACQKRRARRAA